MVTIDIYSDVICPWCFIGKRRMEKGLAGRAATVRWHPFELNPDMPPYHCPVFVLTHHPRKPLEMDGGTVFHFVTDGFEPALEKAKEAAHGKDVRVGGGVATIRQGLRAGLIDEMHLAVSPVLLGRGEHLFGGLDLVSLRYECVEQVGTPHATHVVIRKSG
jgi:dihydrofolate reductase